MTDRDGTSGPRLPDFGAGAGGSGGGPRLPDFSDGSGRPPGGHGGQGDRGGRSPDAPGGHGGPGDPDGRSGKGPLLAILLGGAGFLVVVAAIVALVLSQTLFRADPETPSAGEETSAAGSKEPERTRPSEYVPTEEQTDEAGGEVTFAEQPTVDCTVHENVVETEQVEGAVRGGGLEFPRPEGWEVGTDWGSQGSYLVDQSFAHQPVENGWFTVAGVGAVAFPEEEGGYPGAEEAARAIFQCGLSREQADELYGDPVELVDYRDEAITVDGHPAWIVSADVQLSQGALFHTTDAWRVVVIVVDAPDGPAAFDGGAALGHDQQVADLGTMVEGLRVY